MTENGAVQNLEYAMWGWGARSIAAPNMLHNLCKAPSAALIRDGPADLSTPRTCTGMIRSRLATARFVSDYPHEALLRAVQLWGCWRSVNSGSGPAGAADH